MLQCYILHESHVNSPDLVELSPDLTYEEEKKVEDQGDNISDDSVATSTYGRSDLKDWI